MTIEVLLEGVLIEIGLESEYFLRNFLILSLDALQLGLPLVEVQALRFELYIRH